MEGRSFLLDAKYKGNVEHGRTTISNSDIYEALAFAQASGVHDVLLAYPCRLAGVTPASSEMAGCFREFCTVSAGRVTIRAVELGVLGIAQPHGLKRFSRAFRFYVERIPPPLPVPANNDVPS